MTHINQPLIPAFFTRTVAVLLAILLPPTGLAGEVLYVHTDHLGSPAVYTNAQGEVVAQEFSTPYGRTLNAATPNDTTNDTVSYTGHFRDGDTGLVYMQARYYDPVIGRFLSVDPVTFDMAGGTHFNRYWYANGNPISYTDPTGLCPEGASVVECVEATNVQNAADTTVESNPIMDAALVATKDNVSSSVNNGDTTEKLGYLTGDEEGGYEFVAESAPNAGSDGKTDSVSGTLPEGAAAITHGHIDGKTDGFLTPPGGDPLNLKNVGKPVGTVSNGRVGVWEIKGGKLQFRVIKGRMSRQEARKMRGVVNKAQQTLFNNTGGK